MKLKGYLHFFLFKNVLLKKETKHFLYEKKVHHMINSYSTKRFKQKIAFKICFWNCFLLQIVTVKNEWKREKITFIHNWKKHFKLLPYVTISISYFFKHIYRIINCVFEVRFKINNNNSFLAAIVTQHIVKQKKNEKKCTKRNKRHLLFLILYFM